MVQTNTAGIFIKQIYFQSQALPPAAAASSASSRAGAHSQWESVGAVYRKLHQINHECWRLSERLNPRAGERWQQRAEVGRVARSLMRHNVREEKRLIKLPASCCCCPDIHICSDSIKTITFINYTFKVWCLCSKSELIWMALQINTVALMILWALLADHCHT